MNCDVLVIGAGISGLASAYELSRSGLDVIVLERQVVVGGNAISERVNGFLMEHGPSTVNALVSEANQFAEQLGIAKSRVDLGTGIHKRYLRDANGLHGIRTHALGFLTSPYLSIAGRLSVVCEYFRPQRNKDGEETVHEFVARRFGREFAEKVMEPLAAGLFAGDSRQLSVAAVFPKLVEFEERYGSVTRAVIEARRGTQPGSRLFSWPEGIATLPRALAVSLGKRVRTGTTVKRLRRSKHGFDAETTAGIISARSLVVAAQPHVAATLLENIDPDAAIAAGEIAAPPLSVVFLGFRRSQVAHPLDSLGFLSTKDNAQIVTAAQFCSTMFPGRAPPGHVSLACYVGGARSPEMARLPPRELFARTQEDLIDLLGITGKPVIQRLRHWPRGLPQYTNGHTERIRIIEGANKRIGGLFLVGNYLHGVSVANCLATARAVTAEINAQFTPLVARSFSREAHSTVDAVRS